jgi:signal transduction histidine kinase
MFVKSDFGELDGRVAQARVVLSLLALMILYVDPSLGGLFHLDRWLLIALLCHLLYSSLTYLAMILGLAASWLRRVPTGLDLIFATLIAFLTEGRTSPSFIFFVFAIVAVGFRTGLRDTVMVTLCGVALYLSVAELSGGAMSIYSMRAVYLAIAGYLIGFFGQQRIRFEKRLRELESEAERQAIARSLHDGYLQALAGVSLRLESCRDMLMANEKSEALAEIQQIQIGVTREYDEVREYVHSLAATEHCANNASRVELDTRFRVQAVFAAPGTMAEHIMQIMLEAIRNTRRHGRAGSGAIDIRQSGDSISITIEDDGIGFGGSTGPPWAIASRVAECGGELALNADSSGAHLLISLPAA